MKILLDEDVPHKLVRFLALHEIHTVVSMQWGDIKNGALLALIEGEGFDIFLTGDKNMRSQQRLESRPFAVLVLSAISCPVIEPHIETIAHAIDAAKPGTLQAIDCGEFVRRGKLDKNNLSALSSAASNGVYSRGRNASGRGLQYGGIRPHNLADGQQSKSMVIQTTRCLTVDRDSPPSPIAAKDGHHMAAHIATCA